MHDQEDQDQNLRLQALWHQMTRDEKGKEDYQDTQHKNINLKKKKWFIKNQNKI